MMLNKSYNVGIYDSFVHQRTQNLRYTVISKANNEQFEIFLPSFISIIILMVIGIPGNLLTLLVYTRRLKKAIARQFIMTMATCDFITCAFVMPIELVIMTHFFELDFRWLCKSFRLFSYSVNNISSLTLLTIAFERYRLICKPWAPKFTNSKSRFMCYINIIISVSIALPMFFVYGTQSIPLFTIQNTTTGNLTYTTIDSMGGKIYGKSCLMDDATAQLEFPFSVVTSMVYISLIILAFIILTSLYGHVIKTLINRRKESVCQIEGKIKEASTKRIRKLTFMMIVLTLLYEICYLPCLCVVCVRLVYPSFYRTLSNVEKTIFQLSLKSFLLSSALNPFVYCFCNNEFLEGLNSLLQSAFSRLFKIQPFVQTQEDGTLPQLNSIEVPQPVKTTSMGNVE